jgi:ubiquinone/menaquinone biosynthesis C-methylase UbiE
MGIGTVVLGNTASIGLGNKSTRRDWLQKTLLGIPAGESILDAGAGECQFKGFCKHLKYTSQDFGQYDGKGDGQGLQEGSWDYSKIDIVSDITKIPVPNGFFQNVICTEVLEHVPDPIAVLNELTRVLAEGGRLIITAPFNSLTHFAPYHYCTGFNKYFYLHHADRLGLEVVELSSNGNYFEYVAQELRHSMEAVEKYSNVRVSIKEKISVKLLLAFLQNVSKRSAKSSELGCFGLHFIGRKRGL